MTLPVRGDPQIWVRIPVLPYLFSPVFPCETKGFSSIFRNSAGGADFKIGISKIFINKMVNFIKREEIF